MKIHHKMICCLLPLVFLSGCNKKNDTQETSKPAPNTNVAPAPAASGPAATPGNAAASSSAENSSKMAATEWALKQDEIKSDPNGQWAIQATASSTYSDAQGQHPIRPIRRPGRPTSTSTPMMERLGPRRPRMAGSNGWT
jgi:hypothetical protein